jgi:YHS domain-containing protein
MERDPVCGTFVVPSHALTLAGRDKPVYFCSARCREAYKSGSGPGAGASR